MVGKKPRLLDVHKSFKCVRSYDFMKGTAPDKIPVFLIKNLSPELSPNLAKLLGRCLKEKCFPSTSYLSCLQECGRALILVSIFLSVISKLFEAIIKRILDQLDRNKQMRDKQCGYRSSKYTFVELAAITH